MTSAAQPQVLKSINHSREHGVEVPSFALGKRLADSWRHAGQLMVILRDCGPLARDTQTSFWVHAAWWLLRGFKPVVAANLAQAAAFASPLQRKYLEQVRSRARQSLLPAP